jgi:ParB family chromosome partitioning protein
MRAKDVAKRDELAERREEVAIGLLWLLGAGAGGSPDAEPVPLEPVCDRLSKMLTKGWGDDRPPAALNDDKGRGRLVRAVVQALAEEEVIEIDAEADAVRLIGCGGRLPDVALLRELADEARDLVIDALGNADWRAEKEVLPAAWRNEKSADHGERRVWLVTSATIDSLVGGGAIERRVADSGRRKVIELRLAPKNGAGAKGGGVVAKPARAEKADGGAVKATGAKTENAEAKATGPKKAQGGKGKAPRPSAAFGAAAGPANDGANPAAEGVAPVGGPGGPGAIAVRMLPVGDLRPNDWNPNVLTDEERGHLLEEVRRRGGVPQPVVVRALPGGRWQIIDGEHRWAAAKQAGLEEVCCEVVDADDFEALRQTFVRNERGKRDPLRTGRLFLRMMDQRQIGGSPSGNARRAFAREINVNETTLRNYLLYVRAAEVRHRYAPDGGDDKIARLTVAKVRAYLKLPADRRDVWLDQEGGIEEARRILAERASPSWRRPEAGARPGAAKEGPVITIEEPIGERTPGGLDAPDDGDPGEREPDRGEGATAVADAAAAPEQGAGPALPEDQRAILERALQAFDEAAPATREKIIAGLAARQGVLAVMRRMVMGGS